MGDSSDTDDEIDRNAEELMEIKSYVDGQRKRGNVKFFSGWDDDNEGIDPKRNPNDAETLEILEAAENGDLVTLRRRIKEDPEIIHARDLDGYTPLHRACYNDQVEVVEYLLSVGADVMALTEDKWTPLHSACHWDNALCAVKLIENGAKVNAVTQGGQTPLHLAVAHGASKDCLELLLTNPFIQTDLRNGAGETAHEIAKRSGPYHVLFELHEPCLKSTTNEEI